MSSKPLTVGLEVHAQILAKRKLFSSTQTSFHEKPNSRVSYYDASLPGTQPKLNWDCVRLALRAAFALNARVSSQFSFDRKHYMYPDQPAGYQLTQYFQPYATDGYLELKPRDFAAAKVKRDAATQVRIKQIQIEQDTGKTMYVDETSRVDLNRANSALIEIVTEPDISSPEEAGIFVKKLQNLLRYAGVCSGDMETGSMRVDANVSLGRGYRCEIKNLFSTSAVVAAIRAEHKRQEVELNAGRVVPSETRGWDGRKTWRLRGKEGIIDYRYMPDPELPAVRVSQKVVDSVQSNMPDLPDAILDRLLQHLTLVDANTLIDYGRDYVDFYWRLCSEINPRNAGNWLIHRWLGQTPELPPLQQFCDILRALETERITSSTAKLLLKHLVSNRAADINKLIVEFGLKLNDSHPELEAVCRQIIGANPDVVGRICSGKRNAVGFLLGEVMKETQGTYRPGVVRETLLKLIEHDSV